METISKLTLVLAMLAGNSALGQLSPVSDWESGLYLDHPLVGQIWDASALTFIDPMALSDRLIGARYILLGEKHDNPDHHALQQQTLDHLHARNSLDLVSFEMLDSDAQDRLNGLEGREIATLEELKGQLQWDDAGWDWDFYGPLLGQVQDFSIPMRAGNISQAAVGRVYGEPTPAAIAEVLDAETMAQLNKDIDESHCGLLPASQFPAMVRVQQARDASLAASLRGDTDGGTAVLIAGNYHVRQDLGVPRYLMAQEGDLDPDDIISVSFSEVLPGENDPAVYQQRYGTRTAYDYIWFTPAVSDEDYCESLRQ